MKITVAKHAGYCFGVKKAMELVYSEMNKRQLYTYGPIIHNKAAIKELEEKNVFVTEDLDSVNKGTIVIRTHGEPPKTYDKINSLKNKGIDYLDATCPSVKKIHSIVQKYFQQGYSIIIVGDKNHPEIIGINGWTNNSAFVIESANHAQELEIDSDKIVCVVQTTFNLKSFLEISKDLKLKFENIIIENTICHATELRQNEAMELSKASDVMIVVGDKSSANSKKLFEICYDSCKRTYFIESIWDLQLNNFYSNDKIGITAGASTSPATIKEVVTIMSELERNQESDSEVMQSFEEMLEKSFVSLHTGEIVKGTVIAVNNGEVSVNLGYKSDGIIPREEIGLEQDAEASEVFKPGDEIDVFVVRVNDGDGNVLLSRKRIEAQKGIEEVEKAFESGEVISGKVVDIVKGGMIALYKSVRIFIPSSQVSNRYIEDLTVYKGQTLDFKIIELDRSKRRIVGGRKELAREEENKRIEKVYSSIAANDKVKGTVSRIVDFGAFVDLGGVDGLIHISELSWGTVKSPRDVLKEGQEVEVIVLDVNKEKGKISLSLKDKDNDPWNIVKDKYAIGNNVTGKIVRMVPFGAFVELEPGVDGLIHISQISTKHVAKPEDELSIGQEVVARVTDVNAEQRKISLSIKEADMPEKEASESESTEA